jgi:hypothetical protein
MELSNLTIRIVILLLPGAIATLIVDKTSTHSKWDSFQFVLFSILLGLSSYLVLQMISFGLELHSILSYHCSPTMLGVWRSFVDSSKAIDPREVIVASFSAIPLAFTITCFNERKILNRFAQMTKLSTKYGDENLFFFLLNSRNVYWVYVRRISQNLTYEGKVDSFAATESTYELLLNDVKVYRYSDSKFLYALSNIYLSLPQGDVVLEIPSTKNSKGASNVQGIP